MPGESIFDPGSPEVRRRQAVSLLNDYSHPWDVLAEALQNSVDAINQRYRDQIANQLGVSSESYERGIEEVASIVIDSDLKIHDNEYSRWTSPEYSSGQRERWYVALGHQLAKEAETIKAAYEAVEGAYLGRISITRVDNARKLIIRDNGVGLSFCELKEAVKKGVTLKHGYSNIGELGNGLTYLISACDLFSLKTSNGQEHSQVNIENMYSWISGRLDVQEEPLSNPFRIQDPTEPYTEVVMERIRTVDSDYPDLFDPVMTTERLSHLIRTKTSIGFLYDSLRFPVYNTLRKQSMIVELNDMFQGTNQIVRLDFEYHSPAQIVRDLHAGAAPPLITLDGALALLRDHSDIGGHSIEHTGIYRSETGVPLYYACFLANREWFSEASRSARICDKPSEDDIKDIGRHDLAPLIELGIKGMPTGVSVDPPVTGFQGYWGNFYIMILDNRLKFDEGRKTPVGRRVTLYRDCAKHVLFEKISTEVISQSIRDAVVPMNLAQMMATKQAFLDRRLRNRADLNYDKVKIKNIPKYEQDVITLFHEMIGAGILPYYECLDASSQSTYDSIFRYCISKRKMGTIVQQVEGRTGMLDEKIIIEFKPKAENIIEDISKNVKFYYMMDLLVCWSINASECRRLMATVIQKPMNKVKYWGTTHELQLTPVHFMNVGSGRSLDVICLKEFINKLQNGTYNVS
jgi:hypothetical protein